MGRTGRAAAILWIVFAVVVWNVIFDRVIVLAGRRYVHAAATAAAGGRYERAADWMSPAASSGIQLASAAAGSLLIVGLGAAALADRRERRGRP